MGRLSVCQVGVISVGLVVGLALVSVFVISVLDPLEASTGFVKGPTETRLPRVLKIVEIDDQAGDVDVSTAHDHNQILLANISHESKERNDPVRPVNRRVIVLFSGGLIWILCWWLGAREIDVYGRSGTPLFVAGFVALGSGLLLWCLTDFRWSWGWWL